MIKLKNDYKKYLLKLIELEIEGAFIDDNAKAALIIEHLERTLDESCFELENSEKNGN